MWQQITGIHVDYCATQLLPPSIHHSCSVYPLHLLSLGTWTLCDKTLRPQPKITDWWDKTVASWKLVFFTMKTFRRLQSIVPIQCENIFLARPSVSQNYIFLPGDLRRKQARWSVKKVHPSCKVSPQVFFFQEMEQNTIYICCICLSNVIWMVDKVGPNCWVFLYRMMSTESANSFTLIGEASDGGTMENLSRRLKVKSTLTQLKMSFP